MAYDEPYTPSFTDFEVVPYSQNVLGDTIAITDEDGHIIELRPNDATGYVLNPFSFITLSSAGGAIGAGSGSIIAASLPIVGYIVAGGLLIVSVTALCEKVMTIYHMLSDESKDELSDIVESGSDSFVMSESLSAELERAMGEVFYNDDGSFASSGVTFNPSSMLEYDWDSQYVYGDVLSSSIYKHSLTSSSVALTGTSLSVSLVNSPFDTTSDKALKITNSVTGTSAIFTDDARLFKSLGHRNLSISAPVVITEALSSGVVKHMLGFWVLSECSLLASGQECDQHYVRYDSEFVSEHDTGSSGTYLKFSKTGNDILDSTSVVSQTYLGIQNWHLILERSVDGTSYVTLPYSALQMLASDSPYTIYKNPDVALPAAGTTVFVPPAEVLEDVNYLTTTGALTGEWTSTVEVPTTDTDTDVGFWATVLEPIVNVLKDIKNFFLDLVKMITEGVLNALKAAFIPDPGFFEDYLSDLQDSFSNRMGLLTYPISVLFNFFDRLVHLDEVEPILRWESWSYQDTEFISAGSYNLNNMIEHDTMKTLYNIYLTLVDVGIIFALLHLLLKKYKSIISN